MRGSRLGPWLAKACGEGGVDGLRDAFWGSCQLHWLQRVDDGAVHGAQRRGEAGGGSMREDRWDSAGRQEKQIPPACAHCAIPAVLCRQLDESCCSPSRPIALVAAAAMEREATVQMPRVSTWKVSKYLALELTCQLFG